MKRIRFSVMKNTPSVIKKLLIVKEAKSEWKEDILAVQEKLYSYCDKLDEHGSTHHQKC